MNPAMIGFQWRWHDDNAPYEFDAGSFGSRLVARVEGGLIQMIARLQRSQRIGMPHCTVRNRHGISADGGPSASSDSVSASPQNAPNHFRRQPQEKQSFRSHRTPFPPRSSPKFRVPHSSLRSFFYQYWRENRLLSRPVCGVMDALFVPAHGNNPRVTPRAIDKERWAGKCRTFRIIHKPPRRQEHKGKT